MTSRDLLTLLGLDDFVVIDFETTGLEAGEDQIIEAAAVRFRNGEPVEEFQQLINPGRPIPRLIVELTNITDDMVADQPTVDEVGDEFLKFLGNSPLVGQNIRFDLGFLRVLKARLGRKEEVTNRQFDTLALARTFLYHHTGFSLGALCEFFDLAHEGAHRAFNDALNTGHVFIRLVHEAAGFPLPIIQTLLSVQTHVEIPNKALYISLAQAMSSSGRIKGLAASQIERPVRQAVYESQVAEGDYAPVTPEDYFGPEGQLSGSWDRFEPRPVQVEFAQAVADCFDDGQVLVAEAGTGLGKSMAYLLPAINQACGSGPPVVVACHTKHLQDQLFYTEIPRLVETLAAPAKIVMLKGRGNYLCRSRLDFIISNARRLLGPDDCEQLLPVIIWEQFTQTGDIDECPGFSTRWNHRLWRMLLSERGFCLGKACSRHHGCFLGPIRRAARQAHLIIVNHALLIADSADEVGLLPDEYHLVVDEAHNLAKVATEQLTQEFGQGTVQNLTENYLGSRYRQIFRRQLQDALQLVEEDAGIYRRLQNACRQLQGDTSELLSAFVREHQFEPDPSGQQRSQQGRYVDPQQEFRGLEQEVKATAAALENVCGLLQMIYDALSKSDASLGETLLNEVETDLREARALNTSFKRVAVDDPGWENVLWREVRFLSGSVRVVFRAAPLMVDGFLRRALFERRPGTVLCSATLKVGDSFSYFREEVGLGEQFDSWAVVESDFQSPFMYHEQCAIFSWDTNVDVTDSAYPKALAELIYGLTDLLERRLLVLFTSYAQLRAVHEALYHRLHRTDRRLISQATRSSRRSLLEAFKAAPRAILLGTASFWEGVDLPGELLEMVIVARLPFANPTEPVVEARVEYLEQQGRNPFMEYQIPEAITRFRQGFGRLIRTSQDEGIFIVADSRVTRRRYGRMFLEALPVDAIPFQQPELIAQEASRLIFRSSGSKLSRETQAIP